MPTPNPIKSRITPEKITLDNRNFCRWLGRRKGVSSKALNTAMNIISKGVIEALSEGYAVRFWGVGVFESREMPPRRRWHRLKGEMYIAPASTLVHFKKSNVLNERVRKMAAAKLAKMMTETTAKLAVGK